MGIELMSNPAHSPELVLSDYFLFQSMAHFLRLRLSKNEEVEASGKEFFTSMDQTSIILESKN